MNSRDYWAMRSAQDMVDRMGTAEQTAAEISAAVAQSGEYLAGEVRAVLRGMQSFGISEAEAMQIINAAGDGNALQRFRRAAQRVNDPAKREALMNAINSAGAYRYRIERIGELYNDIDSTCRRLYRTENRLTTSALRTVAEDSYYHEIFNLQQGAGMNFSFSKFSQKDVDRILRGNWFGGNYSQRIWKDMSGLSERLKRELLVSMLTGRSGEKTARIFQERFGVNAYCARRIVRTESAYVANAAQMCAYDEAGIDKYRFVATLDKRTSELCAALDGKVFLTKDAKPGKNYPPMHPFCRSTTIAEFGDGTLSDLALRAGDEDGNIIALPEDIGYEEWYGKYVEGGVPLQLIDNRMGQKLLAIPSGREIVLKNTNDPFSLKHFEGLTKAEWHDIIKQRGTWDSFDVRVWYKSENNKIPNLIDCTAPIEEQARQACYLRSRNKYIARDLMSDMLGRQMLDRDDPIEPFETILEEKMKRKSLTRDEALNDCIQTSNKTRRSIDKQFGLEGFS